MEEANLTRMSQDRRVDSQQLIGPDFRLLGGPIPEVIGNEVLNGPTGRSSTVYLLTLNYRLSTWYRHIKANGMKGAI